jgi:hypothetical protein
VKRRLEVGQAVKVAERKHREAVAKQREFEAPYKMLVKRRKAGRPKGSPNSKTERRHRELAAKVDAVVAATDRLKHARSIVAEQERSSLTTVRTAHSQYGRLFGRGGGKKLQSINLAPSFVDKRGKHQP